MAAYRSQLKARVQKNGETLPQPWNRWHVKPLSSYLSSLFKRAAHAFIDGLRDREVKQNLLMRGDRTLNEALNQALKLEAAKGSPARLRVLTRATARAS